MTAPTLGELADWPATISVPEAGRVLGLGRDAAYAAANAGELPGAIRVGRRKRVITAQLLAALSPPGMGSAPPPDDGGAAKENTIDTLAATGSDVRHDTGPRSGGRGGAV